MKFHDDRYEWATWGKDLMDLHLNYETVEPYGLKRVDVANTRRKGGFSQTIDDQPTLFEQDPPLQNQSDTGKSIKRTVPKAKLKAEKAEGKIILDTATTLEGVPAIAWDARQLLCPGIDSRPIQREETQRACDRQTLQHLQICRLQRTSD